MIENKVIAIARITFLKDPVVPTRAPGLLDRVGHIVPVKPLVELPTGLAALADLEDRTSKAHDIA